MRGEIQHRERARQLRDFSGLRWHNITPTDIDGFVEFRDRLFVFFEAKLKGKDVPQGQRKALERLCDIVSETGRLSAALILEHETMPVEDIDFASCPVCEYRYNGKWNEPIKAITCKAAIDILLDEAHIF